MNRVAWTTTGELQSTDGRADRFDQEISYAAKAEVHLWVVIVTHKVSDQALDDLTAGDRLLLLDVESMLNQPWVGCLVCEKPYDVALRRRKCPGERQ